MVTSSITNEEMADPSPKSLILSPRMVITFLEIQGYMLIFLLCKVETEGRVTI